MPDSRVMFEAGMATMEAALVQSRAERAASEARVARLKAAVAHAAAGNVEEHDRIVAEVRAEQEREGITCPAT